MRFQWLKDYQELDEQILYLKWNLNKSKLELSRWVYGDLADVRIEKNSRSSMLEENIQKIENEIEILEEQRKEMLAIINSFKGIDNEIIRKKYVEGCSLEIIAEEIGYSASYIRQRHADIRKTLDFLDEYEMNKLNRQNKLSEIDYYNKGRHEAAQISLF
ncbi:hypothetical protein EM4838_03060 [Enterococcus mundtii]|uniref:Phage protein n=1 Tax=Enterococcus mundtii TaxID=53346 RepID=A0ABQ0VH47_ENTMU|nr:hypothetical protein [Enterococcus mundtii]AUB52017.1 hypothetical protein EM4838_03060 [Enterococcus mundtii]GEL81970.1 hypothetical protein EMU01_31140 [Enterococcus mundtii]GEN22049.1 hypothetical protein LAC02_53300 [Ligilactobacillus acidipiscis]